MSSTLRGSRLIDACTPSIAYDNQVQSGCSAFDQQMYEIIDDTGQVLFIPNIMGLTDSNLVDILAWQFHVDLYDPTRDLEFRKQLVQLSILWHMTKGTLALVNSVIETYWPGVAYLQEWFQYRDPFPPNYPIVNSDTLVADFTPTNVSVGADKFNITAHGLVNGNVIRFAQTFEAIGSMLPSPLLPDVWYWVVGVTTNSFQVSEVIGGPPVNLTGVGSGTNEIWLQGIGSWHDRYRFRIILTESVDPATEAQVLALIDKFKPLSRWPEEVVRSQFSGVDVFVAAVAQQFINRFSDAARLR